MINHNFITTRSGGFGLFSYNSTNIDSYTINISTNLITKVMKQKAPTFK